MIMFADRTKWNLAPNRLSEALERHRAAGKPFVDLTISNPTECGFAYDERAILAALQNSAALKYKPEPQGLVSARQAVGDYYADCGVSVDIEDVFLTTSTSEAYSYVFLLLCNPGDEILIPAPSYPLVYDRGWQIDFHSLEWAITPRTRALEVEGGWYAILRLPATRSDEDLALALFEEKGVYVHPGHFYDFPHDGFLIVNLICEEKYFQIGLRAF